MSTLYKYKIWCNTESAWVTRWDTTAPSTCPNNNSHSVNTGSVSVTEEVSNSQVVIKEENIPTGGNFLAYSVAFTAATGPQVDTDQMFSWPFPITVMAIRFTTDETHYGDKVTCAVAPNTIVGALAGLCPTGATGATVTQTVIDNFMLGYYINFFNGVNSVDGGRVVNIDKSINKISWETPLTRSFSYLSPTYIRMTVFVINALHVGPPGTYVIGEGKIGGSYVPANIQTRVRYTNNGDIPKNVYAVIELLY